MRRGFWLAAVLVGTVGLAWNDNIVFASGPGDHGGARRVGPGASHRLWFEEGTDPADPAAKFRTRGRGYRLLLGPDHATLKLGRTPSAAEQSIQLRLHGSRKDATLEGLDRLAAKVYDATPSARGLLEGRSTFGKVKYAGVYPGIDLIYYGNDDELEFDFVVAPHADASQVRLDAMGTDAIQITDAGDAALVVGGKSVRLKRPVAYQEINGTRVGVDARYVRVGTASLAFAVGGYDRRYALVIDPIVQFATYFGSAGGEAVVDVKANGFGEVYTLTLTNASSLIPAVDRLNLGPAVTGYHDCILSKHSSDGASLLYAVVFQNGDCQSMALGGYGQIHVAVGWGEHHQRTLTEQNGSLQIGLLNGAYEYASGPVEYMRADTAGNLYLLVVDGSLVPGHTVNALQKISPDGVLQGSVAVFEQRFAPGSGGIPTTNDRVTGMDIDDAGRVYVTGVGTSNNLIVPTANAFRTQRPNSAGEYYSVLIGVDTINGFEIDYASYIGGSNNDLVEAVAYDRANRLVVLGGHTSSPNFPITPSPINPVFPDSFGTAFVMKLNVANPPATQLVSSTILGESSSTVESLAVLGNGDVAIGGQAFVAGFPFVDSFLGVVSGDLPFVSVMSANAQQLLLSTFLTSAGHLGFSPQLAASGLETLLVAISTDEPNRATAGSAQVVHGGDFDGLLWAFTIIDSSAPTNDPPEVDFNPPSISIDPMSPNGALFSLECDLVSHCRVDDPDGDAIVDYLWIGSNGVRLHGAQPPSLLSILPVGTYTFTLYALDERGAVGSGEVTVVVPASNTHAGSNVAVTLTDERFISNAYQGNVHPAALEFMTVTSAGLSSLTSRADLAPPPPAGWQAGSPALYFDINTTASTDNPVTVCFDTTGMSFADPAGVELHQLVNGTWTSIGQSFGGNQVCGVTPGTGAWPRTFAMFYPEVAATRITTLAGTGAMESPVTADGFVNGVLPTKSTLTRPGYFAFHAPTRQLYAAELGQFATVRRIDLAQQRIDVAMWSPDFSVGAIAVDPTGRYLYYVRPVSTGGDEVVKFDLQLFTHEVVAGSDTCCVMPGNGAAATNGYYSDISGLAIDSQGRVYFIGNSTVIQLDADGTTHWLLTYGSAQQPGVPSTGFYDTPITLAIDAQGYLLVGGQTLARTLPGSQTFEHIGGVTPLQMANYATPYAGDGGHPRNAALAMSYQMIVASDGAVLFTDGMQHSIRRIAPGADGVVNGSADETVSTVAGFFSPIEPVSSPFATSQAMDPRGLAEDTATGQFLVASHTWNRAFSFGLSPSVTKQPGVAPDLSLYIGARDPNTNILASSLDVLNNDIVLLGFSVLNQGNGGTIGPVTVTDTLDARLTPGSDPRCTVNGQNVSCSLPYIGPGESYFFYLQAHVADNASSGSPVSITNQAHVATAGDSFLVNNASNVATLNVTPGGPAPDLSVSTLVLSQGQYVHQAAVTSGSLVRLRYAVTNEGDAVSTSTTLSGSLTTQLAFSPADSDARCTDSNHVLSCPVGALQPGQSVTFDVAAVVQAGFDGIQFINRMSVSVLGERNSFNNSDGVILDVVGAAPVVTAPAPITVAAILAGGTHGNAPLAAASAALAAFINGASAVDDDIDSPSQLTTYFVPCATPSAQPGSHDIVTTGTLFAVGTSCVRFQFSDVAGNIGTAYSSVTVLAPVGGQVAGENQPTQATDSNNVPQPVTVTFYPAASAGLVQANPISPASPANFTIIGQAFEISTTVQFTGGVQVCIAGSFVAGDTIYHDGAPVPTTVSNGTACAVVYSLSPFMVLRENPPQADLSIAATAPSPSIRGGVVNYTITVTNHGSDAARGVGILLPLQASYTINLPTPSGATCSFTSFFTVPIMACTVTNPIAAGGQYVMSLSMTPNIEGTITTDFAVVSSISVDPVSANNSASVHLAVNPAADLGVTVVRPHTPIAAGTLLTYTATIRNNGPSTATGVQLLVEPTFGFAMDEGAFPISCVVQGNAYCNFGDLSAGQTITLAVRGIATGPGFATTNFSVFADSMDPSPNNNVATESVTVNRPPVVNAGPDHDVFVSTPTGILLSGSATDPDGDAITSYEWFEGATYLRNGSFTEVALGFGTHTLTLVVTDARGAQGSDTVTIGVRPTALVKPAGVTAVSYTSEHVRVAWSPVPGAEAYRIYRDVNQVTQFSAVPPAAPREGLLSNAVLIATVPASETQFFDNALPTLVRQFYAVQAVNGPVVSDPGGAPEVVVAAAPDAEIFGFADMHSHQMAYLGFGRSLIWGNAFSPAGINDAMPRCEAAHGSGGLLDPVESFLSGGVGHNTSGADPGAHSQFVGWPNFNSRTHQQQYYESVKRAFDGGQRLMVMHAESNEMLCMITPHDAQFGCDDMDSVEDQLQEAKRLEAFVDARAGGDGLGWYQIAYSGEEARHIINSGKMAVVLGIEVDTLFDCGLTDPCTIDDVRAKLNHFQALGVRHVFPVAHFDNAFGGAALFNPLYSYGNYETTHQFFMARDCSASGYRYAPTTGFESAIWVVLQTLMHGNPFAPTAPDFPFAGDCNARSLTSMGEFLVRELMARHMIIDIDHMSELTANRVLTLAEQESYPAIVSGHSGPLAITRGMKASEGAKSTAQLTQLNRIGGVSAVLLNQGERSTAAHPDGVAAHASGAVPNDCGNSSKTFAQSYMTAVDLLGGPSVAAVAIGSDFNGLGGQPGPRFGAAPCSGDLGAPQTNPVNYPFNIVARPGVNAGRLQMSNMPPRIENDVPKPWDFNQDGLAHAGLVPDFIEDLRRVGVSDAYLQPLFRSAEAYVHMWQRAEGSDTPFEAGTIVHAGTNGHYRASSTAGQSEPVTATFGAILADGFFIAEPMDTPPPAPENYVFVGSVFDLFSTSPITPPIVVCIDGAFANGDQLVHFENNNWVDITLPNGNHASSICGQAMSMSPFGVIRRVGGPVDTVPPQVTAVAAPQTLWPADGAMISVTVTGSIVDAGSGVDRGTFRVVDEYGEVQPSGSVTINAAGAYSITVPLKASRRPTDTDGRRYTVRVEATDRAGNAGSATASVLVPYFVDSTLKGLMLGEGRLTDGATNYDVDVLVTEITDRVQLGVFNLKRVKGKTTDQFDGLTITSVAFGASRGATIDSVSYLGTGKWNGKSGYRFEAFVVDRGTPGAGNDEIRFAVFDRSGAMVASFGGRLTKGNIFSYTFSTNSQRRDTIVAGALIVK